MKINETYLSPLMNSGRIDQNKRTVSRASAKSSSRFDTVTISYPRRTAENGPATRLRESISLDVRSAAAGQSERIPMLREQIRSGSYQVDPMAIARKILMQGESA